MKTLIRLFKTKKQVNPIIDLFSNQDALQAAYNAKHS